MGSAVSIIMGRRSKGKSPAPPLPNTNQVQDQPRNSMSLGPATTNRPPSAEGSQTGSFRRPIQVDTSHPETRTITPVKALCKGIDYTETPMGAEKETFKFYCPLCMFYYKDILGTACCKNYVCYTCAVEYIKGKGDSPTGGGAMRYAVPQASPPNENLGTDIETDMDYDIPSQLPSMPCPHCQSNDVQLARVSRDSPLRNYNTSPGAGARPNVNPAHSPVKVGDSFDALRRKMLTFEEEAELSNTSEQPEDSEADLPQVVQAQAQQEKPLDIDETQAPQVKDPPALDNPAYNPLDNPT